MNMQKKRHWTALTILFALIIFLSACDRGTYVIVDNRLPQPIDIRFVENKGGGRGMTVDVPAQSKKRFVYMMIWGAARLIAETSEGEIVLDTRLTEQDLRRAEVTFIVQ